MHSPLSILLRQLYLRASTREGPLSRNHFFSRLLLNADDRACLAMLSERPELARQSCAHQGHQAHPLILLAQWPGRLPQHCDPTLPERAERIAEALFELGADLGAPATDPKGPSCALALLSRMSEHARMEQAWGFAHSASVEPLILKASLRSGSARQGACALAWVQAALSASVIDLASSKDFSHFMGLANALAEQSSLAPECEKASALAAARPLRL